MTGKMLRNILTVGISAVITVWMSGCGGSDNSGTSVDCSFFAERGSIGLQSTGDHGAAIAAYPSATISEDGKTIDIYVSHIASTVSGTLVGGGRHDYLAGSRITWDSTPAAKQDLTGSFIFVLDNGTYEGTISVPGHYVMSPTDIFCPTGGTTFTISKD
jgi:hypothetical protein